MAERQLLEEGAGQPAILLPSTPPSSILIPQLYLRFASAHGHTITLSHYRTITLSLYHLLHYYVIRYTQLLSVVINYHCVIYVRFATNPNPHPHTTTQEDNLVAHYSSRLVDNLGGIRVVSRTAPLYSPPLAAYCTPRCWVLRTSTS